MILRTIRLIDFGLFAGTNEIDLVPRKRQSVESPIILIGGKNGAGKTTLLEAVRLALYGRRALGARVSQTEYETYLRTSIHRSAHAKSAAVGLDFDYAEGGVVHRYRVLRQWSIRGKSVIEHLTLDKDGAEMSSVPREEWHQFLQELIPPGVSQLFFFDGEKIREIADGEEENEQLAEAVRGLLGVELVGRLRTDLGLFLARHERAESAGTVVQLETVLRDVSGLERKAGALAEEVAELQTQKESQARAAERIRRRFVSEGGDAAAQRSRIEAERDETKRQIERIEHELKGLANGLLPFALAPRLVGKFQAALAQTNGFEDRTWAAKAVRNGIGEWRKKSTPKRGATWSAKHWTDVIRFIDNWEKEAGVQLTSVAAFREVGDGNSALERLNEINNVTRPRALALSAELDLLEKRLRKHEASLLRANNAAAGEMLDELRLAEQRVGSTEATLEARQNALKEIRGQLVTLERERNRLLEEQAMVLTSGHRSALAARAASALADYERRLLDHKLDQLRGQFVKRFNQLARKQELIVDVRIDPESFAATLVDSAGKEVPKSNLSAGEKQIYAIAMLWALAKTSERPLPMIIDTPLARLDSDHRGNLIERYFPAASHQVVLLSTDTEVDVSLLAALGRSVSHCYRLDYDPEQQFTRISAGYFGEAQVTEGRRALQQA